MSTVIIPKSDWDPEEPPAVILLDDECYRLLGETDAAATHARLDVDGTYGDCQACHDCCTVGECNFSRHPRAQVQVLYKFSRCMIYAIEVFPTLILEKSVEESRQTGLLDLMLPFGGTSNCGRFTGTLFTYSQSSHTQGGAELTCECNQNPDPGGTPGTHTHEYRWMQSNGVWAWHEPWSPYRRLAAMYATVNQDNCARFEGLNVATETNYCLYEYLKLTVVNNPCG